MKSNKQRALEIIDSWSHGRLPGAGNAGESIELKPLEGTRWLQQPIDTRPFEFNPMQKPPR